MVNDKENTKSKNQKCENHVISGQEGVKTSHKNVTPLRPTRPCPECDKPSKREYFPFCSPRCRAIDLNRWLSGSYVLPGRTLQDDQELDESPIKD